MRLTSFLALNRCESLFLPAHSRGSALPKELQKLLRKEPGSWDLPEIPEFGGPLLPDGLVEESQRESASRYGANRCWYGVNGATGLLQAALLSIARSGQSVLMPRNVHKSLVNACALSGIKPVLFDLPFLSDRGHYFPPDENWFKTVLVETTRLNEKIVAGVLVNPTYHGYAIDIAPLVNLLHSYDLPVLVDEAHGTYFVSSLRPDLPQSALTAGADLVVHSLHKSAPGLVQSAVLWLSGERVDPIAVERSIGWLQTSSPSSLLLASCESALRELKSNSGKRKLLKRLKEAEQLKKGLIKKGIPLIENHDPFRFVLHTGKLGINGLDVDKFFISKNIICELPEPGSITFCIGFAQHPGLQRRFVRHWKEFLSLSKAVENFKPFPRPPIDLVMSPTISCSLAWRSKSEEIFLNEAYGRICAELICPYPPGIPIFLPGELLDGERVDWLIEQKRLWVGQIPEKIKVVI